MASTTADRFVWRATDVQYDRERQQPSRSASMAEYQSEIEVPLHPPLTWFRSKPEWLQPLQKVTVVTDGPESGRVAGYVAPWGQCLLGSGKDCWTAPQSPTAYAAAHQGRTMTADGGEIPTAIIPGSLNHFRLDGSFAGAVDYYAHTGRQLMRVCYFEDEHGIYALGALWPGITQHQGEVIRASALSGDWRWRPELNSYDFAGSQLVTLPGFPLIPGHSGGAKGYSYGMAAAMSGTMDGFRPMAEAVLDLYDVQLMERLEAVTAGTAEWCAWKVRQGLPPGPACGESPQRTFVPKGNREKAADAWYNQATKIIRGYPDSYDALDDAMKLAKNAITANLYEDGYYNGEWTQERSALHSEILDKTIADLEASGVPRDHKMLLLGGPSGSGKSTLLSTNGDIARMTDGAKFAVIDPDMFKKELYPYVRQVAGLSPAQHASLVHEESQRLSHLYSDWLEENGYNMAWDITMSTSSQVGRRIKEGKDAGFQVFGAFASVDPAEATQSVRLRYEELQKAWRETGAGDGGRYVPKAYMANQALSGPYRSVNEQNMREAIDNGGFDRAVIIDQTGIADRTPAGTVELAYGSW